MRFFVTLIILPVLVALLADPVLAQAGKPAKTPTSRPNSQPATTRPKNFSPPQGGSDGQKKDPEIPLAPAVAALMAEIESTLREKTPHEMTRAIHTLCGYKETRIFELLTKILEHRNEPVIHRAVAMGVVRSFPRLAASFFLPMAESGTKNRRSAALYGLAHIRTSRTYEVVSPLLTGSTEKWLREAALVIPEIRGTRATRALMKTAYEQNRPVPDSLLTQARTDIKELRQPIVGNGQMMLFAHAY